MFPNRELFANFVNDTILKRIFSRGTLKRFWQEYPETEKYLKTWYQEAKQSDWLKPSDVINTYTTVSILKNGRAVFNIKGNDFRLIVKINYERQWVFIRFIGTHQDYNNIDANTI